MRARPVELAVAAAALLLFWCLTVVMLNGGMAGFDGAVRMAVHKLAVPWLTSGIETMTFFGSLGVLAVFSGIAVVALVRAGRRRDAWFVLFVMAGAVILENTAKFSIQRPRPPPFFGIDPTSYSFPSGHAMFSLCFYGALAVILSRRGASRSVVWAGAVCLVAAIGGTRIYLGVHYPSDVLAGYLLAIAWLSAALAAMGGRASADLPGGGGRAIV
jgi:undecaprenyl-diphosphatase